MKVKAVVCLAMLLSAPGFRGQAFAQQANETPLPPIRHRFLALDESRKQLLLVDQNHPQNDWTLKLPRDATPRDFQVIGDHQALIASGKGYLQCDLKSGILIRQVDCVDDKVISLRRLSNGHTLLIGRDSGRLYEVDQQGSLVRTTQLPVKFARLMRFTPQGHLVFCPDSQIMEIDTAGRVLHTVPFRVQADPQPAKRSGYHVLKKLDGNYLVSTCYTAALAEVTPAGQILRTLGGRESTDAQAMNWLAFTGFQILPNQHAVVTTWNGHGPQDSRNGPQLVQFDPQGKVVWQWHDAQRAGSILAVVVLDELDTSKRLEEHGHVLQAAP